MYTGRLGYVRRREDHHRKFMLALNDAAKNRRETTENYMKRVLDYKNLQHERYSSQMRKSIIEKTILQKSLALRRENTGETDNNNLFGHYGGVPIHEFSKDMHSIIQEGHPKKRKQKKIKQLLMTSKKKGMILETDTMKEKVQDYFTEKWGVKYPEKTNKEKKESKFDMKNSEGMQPTVSSSTMFKPTLRRGFPPIGARSQDEATATEDGDVRLVKSEMSVDEARHTLYHGLDKHWNCKRCFHVDKVRKIEKIHNSPRAQSESSMKTDILVLPDIKIKSILQRL